MKNLQMLLPFISVSLLVLLLSGCATPVVSDFENGKKRLAEGDYLAAYRFLETPNAEHDAEITNMIKNNPQLVAAGLKTFSEEALQKSKEQYGKGALVVEVFRLERFQLYATSEQ